MLALVALFFLGGDRRHGVYLLIFSTAIGVGACVIGITAVLKARKTGTYRPRGSVLGIVIGALATVVSIPILVLYLTYPHQVDNYINCLNQSQNQQSCMDKFYKSIQPGAARVSRPDNRVPNHGS